MEHTADAKRSNFMRTVGRINRGVVLTAAIFLVLVIYLIALGLMRNAEKPAISAIAEEYIHTETEYTMLPEDQRMITPRISQRNLAQYGNDMIRDISSYFISKKANYEFNVNFLRESHLEQAKGINVITESEKEILRFNSFVFDKDTVTVDVLTKYTRTTTTQNEPPIGNTVDRLMLQKVDGKWKLIYANISYKTNNIDGEEGEVSA
ncbi:MAG: hypothetical protein FWH14_02615 [Oscillospiraceae bacterium]|nr:hypothetical protein [Oscillospiraceae bacterium]